ncbi:hypothetical protein [Edaphobacter bradus]|nr:hypothetical protein [Edaphobacter bradus]
MEPEAVIALVGEDEFSGPVGGLFGGDLGLGDGGIAALAVATPQ